jgi:hypothetical protein
MARVVFQVASSFRRARSGHHAWLRIRLRMNSAFPMVPSFFVSGQRALSPQDPIRSTPMTQSGQPTNDPVAIQFNHGWTQMNTDQNCSQPHPPTAAIGSTDSDPKQGEAETEPRPQNPCQPVFIRGSLLHGYGLPTSLNPFTLTSRTGNIARLPRALRDQIQTLRQLGRVHLDRARQSASPQTKSHFRRGPALTPNQTSSNQIKPERPILPRRTQKPEEDSLFTSWSSEPLRHAGNDDLRTLVPHARLLENQR